MAYQKSAAYYDVMYRFKDYARESDVVHGLIQQHKRSTGNQLLEVACGTGAHLATLRDRYHIEALDLSEEMLAVARQKFPEVVFYQGDMRDFDLPRRFDVVICLFSSVGYMKTQADLNAAVANMGRHLVRGGVLLIEPWFSPEQFRPNTLHGGLLTDTPTLKVCRMSVSRVEGRLSSMDMHHLIGTPEGVEHFVERHEMGLFTHDEYQHAFAQAGLTVQFDAQGLDGRGLYIGRR